MISAPEAFKRLSEYLNRKTEQEENLQESPIVFADNYEENLFRRIHEFNEILEYLKKTYRHYDIAPLWLTAKSGHLLTSTPSIIISFLIFSPLKRLLASL